MNLPEKIYNLVSFQRELLKVIKYSVARLFPVLNLQDDLFSSVNWNHLLMCASALAHSDNPDCQDAALRIAQCCLTHPDTTKNQRVASSVIFHKLTNRPAIELALKKEHLPADYESDIPLPFQIENTQRDVEHIVFTKDTSEPIYLNRFQKDFYDKAHASSYISASAPTSSGKSFILNTFVLEQLSDLENPKNIVYLVPTRALINQVEQDFSDQLFKSDNHSVYLSSVPQLPEDEDRSKPSLFIFTQERLHWFLNENKDYQIDFLIVDEAHKIGDGGRGVLLQQKIEELVTRLPNLKMLFCSPFSQNPEILLDGLPNPERKSIIVTEYVAVNQNLIWVSQASGHPRQWGIDLCLKTSSINLGVINTNDILGEKEKLPTFCHLLGSEDGGNMVYVNGQADAEDVSEKLFDLVGESQETENAEIAELIDLTKKLIHTDYVLAKVLKRKIAFHYGNMPLVIRKEIERLYTEGHIKYLVCTSTLLEGVNLPAKSIFIRKPKRGNRLPMAESDFWNLAGRAGRLKKEFQGNIICIDPEEWDNRPVREKTKHFIKRAIAEISESREELLDYMKGTSEGVFKPNLEYAFSYYFSKFLKNRTLQGEPLEANYITELEAECVRVKETLEVPEDIIYRNPGISPTAQQKLLEYFKNYDKDVKNLIPVLPDTENAALGHYVAIIKRISKILSGDHEGLAPYHAILVINWMNGYPLARIIRSNIAYWGRKDPQRKLSKIIRDTMGDIEEYVRFKFAKYSSCYIDILKYYLGIEHPELLESVPQLNMWVEFGVSQRTQISLINLGLSRHTAIELSEYLGNTNLGRKECIEWLLVNNASIFDITTAAKKEIGKLMESLLRKSR